MDRYVEQDETPPAPAARRRAFAMVLLLAGFCVVAAAIPAAGSRGRTPAGMLPQELSAAWLQPQAFPVPRDLGAPDPFHRVSGRSRAGVTRAGAWVAEPAASVPPALPERAGLEVPEMVGHAARAVLARAPRGPPSRHVSC